ncbi:MAG: arylesterase [Gemmatimonadaceae bacterium]
MRTEISDVGEQRGRAPAWRGEAGGLLLVLLLAVLGATACGGDDRESSTRRVAAAGARSTGEATPAGGRPAAAAKDSARTAASPANGGNGTGPAVPTVLVAGTSLTAGLGLDPADAYPAVLQELADSAGLPVRIVNGGSSGETSAGLVRRIDWLLREPTPDVVVIETGANDGLRGVDPAVTKANLRRVVRAVRERAPGARVLLVQMEAPPNLGASYTARFRAMYAEVARESGATLVPFLLEGVAGEPSLNQADGIHPNEEGARMAAHTLWRALAPLLAEVDQSGNMR